MVDDFDRFWSEYPRRVGKLAARREWDRAVRTVDPETLISAARRYAIACEGREMRYIAHPRTWLHQGRWDDDDCGIAERHVFSAAAEGGHGQADLFSPRNQVVKTLISHGMDSVIAERFFGGAELDDESKKILVDSEFCARYIAQNYDYIVRRAYPSYEVCVRERKVG